jgi:hypothetical protein
VKKNLGVTCIVVAIYLTAYIVFQIPELSITLSSMLGLLYMCGLALLGIKSAANLVSKNIDKKQDQK